MLTLNYSSAIITKVGGGEQQIRKSIFLIFEN